MCSGHSWACHAQKTGLRRPRGRIKPLNTYVKILKLKSDNKMKKLIAFFLFTGIAAISFAQHETFFSNTRLSGAFGAPIMEVGFNNDMSTAVGGGGAIGFSDFFIGAYGMASGDFQGLLNDSELERLDIGHGGLWLGFTPRTYSLIHIYSSARIGWGALDIDLRDGGISYSDLDKVFVLTPEIGLEANLTKWLRLSGTIGYRWVRGVEDNGLVENRDFTGSISSITLRIGWFGHRRY